ncbi:isochorismatase family protein [Patulibacter sp. S7RM1-6]
MSPKSPWSDVITEDDERRYEAAGFGRPSGFGKRPALVIIDVQHRTMGNSPKPFFESLEDYTTSCGDVGWAAVEQIAKLLAVFREFDLPVLYPHVAPKTDSDRQGTLGAKVPGIMDVPDHGYRFPDAVAPRPGDLLLPKKHPSAFFGTPLASYLIGLGADTIVTTGATTSGCVRGTVVDAFSYNFKCVVPHDAVYDRTPTVHQANLFDLGQKYADVSSTDEVVAKVREIGEAA